VKCISCKLQLSYGDFNSKAYPFFRSDNGWDYAKPISPFERYCPGDVGERGGELQNHLTFSGSHKTQGGLVASVLGRSRLCDRSPDRNAPATGEEDRVHRHFEQWRDQGLLAGAAGHSLSRASDPLWLCSYSSKVINREATSRNQHHFTAFRQVNELLGERPLVLDREFSYLELLENLVAEEVIFVIWLKVGPNFCDQEGKPLAEGLFRTYLDQDQLGCEEWPGHLQPTHEDRRNLPGS
jgi:hypothetical protein